LGKDERRGVERKSTIIRKKIVTITGGNGFIGRILQSGLRKQGYQVVIFDRMKGFWVDLLRARYLGTSTNRFTCAMASMLRNVMRFEENICLRAGIIVPSEDDILDLRSRLIERFRGSDAVIHLAALPHPNVPGVTDSDFRRINYGGSINVFEAAREAGVSKFIFASSCQVYGINKPVRIDQFPIIESNYCPTLAEGQSMYGLLKREFERYLEQQCRGGSIQAISLRLEFPGVRSRFPWNFYINASIENTVNAFVAALEANLNSGFDVFNIADRDVDNNIVNIQDYLKKYWPNVPNYTVKNECLLSTEKARSLMRYNPQPGGTYFSFSVMW
jgi:nucleoside-diphosphate-sugar epimerase